MSVTEPWLQQLLLELGRATTLPPGLTDVALEHAREHRDIAVALARTPGLPERARRTLVRDRRAAVRVELLTRPDLRPDEITALLAGEKRPSVLDAARTHGYLPPAAPAPRRRRSPTPDDATLLENALTSPPPRPGAVPTELLTLLHTRPDLLAPALERLDVRAGARPDLATLFTPELTGALLTVDMLAGAPRLGGTVLAHDHLAAQAGPALRTATAVARAAGAVIAYNWWYTAFDELAHLNPHAPLGPTTVAILADELAGTPTLFGAMSPAAVTRRLPEILDGLDGTGPNAGRWPAPGTDAAGRWHRDAATCLRADTIPALPPPIRAALFAAAPGPVLTAAKPRTAATAALAAILPAATSAWPPDDARWRDILAVLGTHPRDRSYTPVVKALLEARNFDLATTGGHPAFTAHVPRGRDRTAISLQRPARRDRTS